MYGHEAEYYQSEVKMPEIVSDYAEDMFSLLCEVMSELEGSVEHSELYGDVSDMVNTISREQCEYV